MKLTTVKEIYKEREKYLDKEVTVGGWVLWDSSGSLSRYNGELC